MDQVAGFPVIDWKEGGLIDCLSGQGIHTRDVGTRGVPDVGSDVITCLRKPDYTAAECEIAIAWIIIFCGALNREGSRAIF